MLRTNAVLALGLAVALAPLPAAALESPARDSINALIEAQAKASGLPASFVHRVVKRESNYNPNAVGGGALGLMQIKLATARGLGYKGTAAGLFDAKTNLTYAVAYLAGAYRTAKGNEALAYSYYNKGYYYAAKRNGIVTDVAAVEPDPVPAAPAPTFATSAFGQFLIRGFGSGQGQGQGQAQQPAAVASADAAAAPAAAPAPAPATPAGSASPFAAAQGGSLGASAPAAAPTTALAYAGGAVPVEQAALEVGAAADEPGPDMPLPPRRPRELRHFAKVTTPAAPKTADAAAALPAPTTP